MSQALPKRHEDFSGWYHEVITQGQLVDASPTRGCAVFRPYGYAIWEAIQREVDTRFKKKGIENAYFPLLIPESFLKKEADHVEGFSPELAVVTHAGGKQLEEPYVVRPTSETIIYHMFSRWITSWRDLPLRINQWANVVRWEMRTRPFLRTAEFLWQEGHTAHATQEEAELQAKEMLALYIDFIEKQLCIPLFTGRKTKKERFAGAVATYTMEAITQDGKALQMGTSHLLANSFPAAYGVQFQDKDGQLKTPWCTSWGITTRLIGAAIMVHGDDQGLVLPPAVAPYQVVIVPIYKTDAERETVLAFGQQQAAALESAGFRVHVDTRDERPGAKFYFWEMRGVPVRIEVGPRDVAQQVVILSTRIPLIGREKKVAVAPDTLAAYVTETVNLLATAMYEKALENRTDSLLSSSDMASFGVTIANENGYVRAAWCGSESCESALEEYKAGIRCILDETATPEARCFACTEIGHEMVIIAKSY